MSEQEQQDANEGIVGQSASTGGLARCPCGAVPQMLGIMDTGQGGKYKSVMGSCCGEWMIEFRANYHADDSLECMELAIEAWNRAPRMANVQAQGGDASPACGDSPGAPGSAYHGD